MINLSLSFKILNVMNKIIYSLNFHQS